jgi:hypothetical protein
MGSGGSSDEDAGGLFETRLCAICSRRMLWVGENSVLNDRRSKREGKRTLSVRDIKSTQDHHACRSRHRNARLLSQISVEPTNSDSEQFGVRTAHCALLTDATIRSHIVVGERVAMPVCVRRVYQA